MTVHGMPMDITEDQIGIFFTQYRQVEDISAVISKAGIATKDFVLQMTVTCRSFVEIPNILMYWEKRMFVVMEGH